jgi:hypothetical protein
MHGWGLDTALIKRGIRRIITVSPKEPEGGDAERMSELDPDLSELTVVFRPVRGITKNVLIAQRPA